MKVQSIYIGLLCVISIFLGCDQSTTGTAAGTSLLSKFLGSDTGMSESNSTGAGVTIPEGTPFWDNSAIKIDNNFINGFAGNYCKQAGDKADALEFIAGNLPLASVDEFCQGARTKETMAQYLGNMYLSGYYGGVWLRDVLFANSGDTQSGDLVGTFMSRLPEVLKQITELGADELMFKSLAAVAGGWVDLSLKGSSSEVINANLLSVDVFLMIYGYDYGYYYYLLDNPPEGTSSVASPLSCNSFMDCSMNNIELTTLNRYKPVLGDLLHPKYWNVTNGADVRWTEMNASMNAAGTGSVEVGKMIWNIIMSNDTMFDSAYLPLIDLSARFMLVSELTLLPAMKCYAERDVEAGRCGLLQESGMITWLIGYAMGLASDLPKGTFPTLTCK